MMIANCTMIVGLSDLTLSMKAAIGSNPRGLEFPDHADLLVARHGRHVAYGATGAFYELQHLEIACFHRRGIERVPEGLLDPQDVVALRVHPQRLDHKLGQGRLIVHGNEPYLPAEFLVAEIELADVFHGQFYVRTGNDIDVRAGCRAAAEGQQRGEQNCRRVTESHGGLEADRPLRQQLIEEHPRRRFRDGMVQLHLERGIRGQVVAQPGRLPAVGAPGGERGEIIVRLVQGGPFQANVRGPAVEAPAHLRESGPARVTAGSTREVYIAERVILGDDFPRGRVERRVASENVYAGNVQRQAIVAHDRAVAVYADLEQIGTAAEQVAQVEARAVAGFGFSGIVGIKSVGFDGRAVAHENVIGEPAAPRAHRPGAPYAHGVDRDHAAGVFEIDHLRPQHRGLQLLAVVKCGVPVAERRMEAAEPDGGRIAEGITDLQSLEIRRKVAGFFVLEHELDHRFDVRRQLGRKIEIEGTVEEALVATVSQEIRADIGKSLEQGRGRRGFAPDLRDAPLVFVFLDLRGRGRPRTQRRAGLDFLEPVGQTFYRLEAPLELALELPDPLGV